jgi:hypothetical protein
MNWRINEGYNKSLKKNLFFEKVNKINKLLAKLTKRRKEKTQINEIRHQVKRGYYNRHQKVKKIIQEYFENLY